MSQWITEKRKPDYEYLTYTVEMLNYVYPFLKLDTVGYSWAGRKIYSLSLGNPESCSIYTASTHASEWITTLVLLRFAENLCKTKREGGEIASIDINKILREKGAVFIPCLNPDGVEINLNGYGSAGVFADKIKGLTEDFSHWNANARGVDLNHNFDAGWEQLQKMEKMAGIIGPSPRQFGGKIPESELETYALTKLCRENDFNTAFALHAQGEEIFYTYGDYTPPQSELMGKILASSSGYSLVTQTGLASHGGFKDWFIREFGRPAFTMELGKGKNPLPIDDLESIYEKVHEMLLLGLLF